MKDPERKHDTEIKKSPEPKTYSEEPESDEPANFGNNGVCIDCGDGGYVSDDCKCRSCDYWDN